MNIRTYPEYKIISGKKYKFAGVFKNLAESRTRAVSARKRGWDVRVHPYDLRTGKHYVLYQRLSKR